VTQLQLEMLDFGEKVNFAICYCKLRLLMSLLCSMNKIRRRTLSLNFYLSRFNLLIFAVVLRLLSRKRRSHNLNSVLTLYLGSTFGFECIAMLFAERLLTYLMFRWSFIVDSSFRGLAS